MYIHTYIHIYIYDVRPPPQPCDLLVLFTRLIYRDPYSE